MYYTTYIDLWVTGSKYIQTQILNHNANPHVKLTVWIKLVPLNHNFEKKNAYEEDKNILLHYLKWTHILTHYSGCYKNI